MTLSESEVKEKFQWVTPPPWYRCSDCKQRYVVWLVTISPMTDKPMPCGGCDFLNQVFFGFQATEHYAQ